MNLLGLLSWAGKRARYQQAAHQHSRRRPPGRRVKRCR